MQENHVVVAPEARVTAEVELLDSKEECNEDWLCDFEDTRTQRVCANKVPKIMKSNNFEFALVIFRR